VEQVVIRALKLAAPLARPVSKLLWMESASRFANLISIVLPTDRA